ncbi:hypothetical protein BGY98DRAFT_931309 [Russula aff. rugulosa BPL654]|nr:hypothetical protein BGY98DRAFT_931309 [Russula aff. rugulosa BPL654]
MAMVTLALPQWQELLEGCKIANVDIDIRESKVTRSAGPRLPEPAISSDPTACVREPFMTTLGLPICAQSTPNQEDRRFEYKNDSRHNVMLFGGGSFAHHLESIQTEIKVKPDFAKTQRQRIRLNKGKDDPVANEERQEAQVRLNEAREAIEQLNAFYQVLLDREDNFAQNQVLGKVILSPPIGVGVGLLSNSPTMEPESPGAENGPDVESILQFDSTSGPFSALGLGFRRW